MNLQKYSSMIKNFFEQFAKELMLGLGVTIGSTMRVANNIRMKRKVLAWFEVILAVSLFFCTVIVIKYTGLEDSALSSGIGFLVGYGGMPFLNAIKNVLLDKVKDEVKNEEK